MSDKVKNETVPASVFVPAMVSGIKAGLSNKVIAASIGMTEATFAVRKSTLVRQAKEKAASDPTYVNPFLSLPKRSRSTKGAALDLLSTTMAKLDADPVVIAPEGEATA